MKHLLLFLTAAVLLLDMPVLPETYVRTLWWPSQPYFAMPSGLGVDSSGNVYVADTSNHRIVKLNSSGQAVLTFGSKGWRNGEFRYPEDVAISSEGYIYVADTGNCRIQKFDSSGNFLGLVGGYWTSQTSGVSNALYSLSYVSDGGGLVAWVCGAGGVIRKTTNGGVTWSALSSGTSSDLYSIWFHGDQVGWVVGAGGLIKKTTNGGTSWSTVSSGTTNNLYAVQFIDSWSTGLAVGAGGTIRRSTNGGSSWFGQTSNTTNDLHGVFLLDTNTNFAVGKSGTILRTTNGGSTWTVISSGTTNNLYSVYFRGSTGWVVGAGGTILKTTNGGDTWVAKSSGTTSDLRSVIFVDDKRGWAAGDAGTVLYTEDAGESWTPQATGTGSTLYSVRYCDAEDGFAVGSGGVILRGPGRGADNGRFDWPVGICVDDARNLVFVADTGQYNGSGFGHRIQVFDKNLNYKGKTGGYGSGNGLFNMCNGVTVKTGSNLVFATDPYNQRIQKFSTTVDGSGNVSFSWLANLGVYEWQMPRGLSWNAVLNKFAYAAPRYDRVDLMDENGSKSGPIGGKGWGTADVDSSAGRVYVADTRNHRIAVFTTTGGWVTAWGERGSGVGQFEEPMGVAVDSSGNVYVADTGNHRVQVFDSNGNFVRSWGSFGLGDGQFVRPRGIFVSGGSVFVADTENNRCQKFTTGGSFVCRWSALGSAENQLRQPTGICIDSSGYAYVVERSNHRVQKFQPVP